MSKAKQLLESLVAGDEAAALALAKESLTESSSELVAAGTQYILQTAIDAYTNGLADDDLREGSDEDEDDEENDNDNDSGQGADGNSDKDNGNDDDEDKKPKEE